MDEIRFSPGHFPLEDFWGIFNWEKILNLDPDWTEGIRFPIWSVDTVETPRHSRDVCWGGGVSGGPC